jgi:lysophospholipase L1-like esterase
MAKLFFRLKFGARAGLALTAACVLSAHMLEPASAGMIEKLEPACHPAGFSEPIADLHRTAAKMRAKAPVRILTIGSSSTQGIGATSPAYAYPAQLMTDLNSESTIVSVDVRNAGIGGETIEQTLKRLVGELDTYKPDLVIWQVGTNDAITGGSDPKVFQRLISIGIKSILSRNVDAMLIDPQYYPKIPNMDIYEHYVQIVHDAADENGIVVFPRFKLMLGWNNLPGGVVPMLGPDSFHMGDRGYTCLAGLLAEEIIKSVAHTDASAVAASPALLRSPATGVSAKVGTVAPVKAVQPAQ